MFKFTFRIGQRVHYYGIFIDIVFVGRDLRNNGFKDFESAIEHGWQ